MAPGLLRSNKTLSLQVQQNDNVSKVQSFTFPRDKLLGETKREVYSILKNRGTLLSTARPESMVLQFFYFGVDQDYCVFSEELSLLAVRNQLKKAFGRKTVKAEGNKHFVLLCEAKDVAGNLPGMENRMRSTTVADEGERGFSLAERIIDDEDGDEWDDSGASGDSDSGRQASETIMGGGLGGGLDLIQDDDLFENGTSNGAKNEGGSKDGLFVVQHWPSVLGHVTAPMFHSSKDLGDKPVAVRCNFSSVKASTVLLVNPGWTFETILSRAIERMGRRTQLVLSSPDCYEIKIPGSGKVINPKCTLEHLIAIQRRRTAIVVDISAKASAIYLRRKAAVSELLGVSQLEELNGPEFSQLRTSLTYLSKYWRRRWKAKRMHRRKELAAQLEESATAVEECDEQGSIVSSLMSSTHLEEMVGPGDVVWGDGGQPTERDLPLSLPVYLCSMPDVMEPPQIRQGSSASSDALGSASSNGKRILLKISVGKSMADLKVSGTGKQVFVSPDVWISDLMAIITRKFHLPVRRTSMDTFCLKVYNRGDYLTADLPLGMYQCVVEALAVNKPLLLELETIEQEVLRRRHLGLDAPPGMTALLSSEEEESDGEFDLHTRASDEIDCSSAMEQDECSPSQVPTECGIGEGDRRETILSHENCAPKSTTSQADRLKLPFSGSLYSPPLYPSIDNWPQNNVLSSSLCDPLTVQILAVNKCPILSGTKLRFLGIDTTTASATSDERAAAANQNDRGNFKTSSEINEMIKLSSHPDISPAWATEVMRSVGLVVRVQPLVGPTPLAPPCSTSPVPLSAHPRFGHVLRFLSLPVSSIPLGAALHIELLAMSATGKEIVLAWTVVPLVDQNFFIEQGHKCVGMWNFDKPPKPGATMLPPPHSVSPTLLEMGMSKYCVPIKHHSAHRLDWLVRRFDAAVSSDWDDEDSRVKQLDEQVTGIEESNSINSIAWPAFDKGLMWNASQESDSDSVSSGSAQNGISDAELWANRTRSAAGSRVTFKSSELGASASMYSYSPSGRTKTPRHAAPVASEWAKLAVLIERDPLEIMSEEERAFMWKFREALLTTPRAVCKLTQCVPWHQPPEVCEFYSLLPRFAPMTSLAYLELLDCRIQDPVARLWGVLNLQRLRSDDVALVGLQLVQTMKFECQPDSALARFILHVAHRHAYVANMLFWGLRSELYVEEARLRFVAMLESLLLAAGRRFRWALYNQITVMGDWSDAADKIKSISKDARLKKLREFLENPALLSAGWKDSQQQKQTVIAAKSAKKTRTGAVIGVVEDDEDDTSAKEDISLALDPQRLAASDILLDEGGQGHGHCVALDMRMEMGTLVVNKCRYMDSKKLPLWLTLKSAHTDGLLRVMFKMGDDLRQDALTLQLLGIMDRVWQSAGLDLELQVYGCIATAFESGFIQIVENSDTISNIQKLSGGALGAFKEDPILRWLESERPEHLSVKDDIQPRFVRSCAGYCVATYVLGIGDRHNDNIMVTREGHFFHIDFGHFLGNIKRKFGVRRERAPFVFTPDIAYAMGGRESQHYVKFVELCKYAYNILRKHKDLFISLFALMLGAGIPELQTAEDIRYLQEAFATGLDDSQAAEKFQALIDESLNSTATRVNFLIHNIAHPS